MTEARSPWGVMMRTAAMMGISPAAFWRLSLAEWRMLIDGRAGEAPITRSALTEMAEMWPDD